jgi:hypothetical protein
MPAGMIDLVGGDLPLPVGGGVAVSVPPSDVDVMIDQVPFWLAISRDQGYQRETAQFQRDQVDNQPEAGEQSLAGWWTRSQLSFHMGAGLDFLDTTARPQDGDRQRFRSARNVDCWTPGVVKRLNGTQLAHPVGAGERVWLEPADGGLLVAARASKLEVWDGAAWTERNYGSPFPIRAFAVDGSSYYVATIDGIYQGAITGGTASKVYDLPGTDVPMVLGWVKQRLLLGHGPRVHVLDVPGPTLPAAQYTHPTASWRWTTFCDTPGAIAACGYAGLQSGVISFAVEKLNDAPVLGAGTPLLTMPVGERILSSLYYLGSLIVLGTDRGIRVCEFNSYYGSVTLGPLTVLTESGVTALAGYDRYVFAGSRFDGETACLRVDLSSPLDDAGHYAWAPDLPLGEGTITAITFADGDLKVIGVQGVGVHTELDGPDLSQPAWLETARIRFGTVEDKLISYAQVRGAFDQANVLRVEAMTAGGEWATIANPASRERFSIKAPRAEWVALRFQLDGDVQLGSYQLQALPGGRRQRLISFPVAVVDHQQTRSGLEAGYEGWALDRLAAIEALEQAGAEVTITAPALFPAAMRGVIERLSFVQTADPGDRGSGTGGVLQIVVRTTS